VIVSGLYCHNCNVYIYSRTGHDIRGCLCRETDREKSIMVDGGQLNLMRTICGEKSNYTFLKINLKNITMEDLIKDFYNKEHDLGMIKEIDANKEIIRNINAIEKENLEDSCYYLGICRNSRVAQWNEKENCFYYIRRKFDATFIEKINHPEDDDGYDLFIPYQKINLDLSDASTAAKLFPVNK